MYGTCFNNIFTVLLISEASAVCGESAVVLSETRAPCAQAKLRLRSYCKNYSGYL